MAYKDIDKLSRFIRVHKDRLPSMLHNNVMYKINCGDYDASYVGQTSKTLKTRIGKHKNHINWRTQHSVTIVWNIDMNSIEIIEILDEERILNKRLISEMIFIRKQKNSLNLQTDTELLDNAYSNLLINKLSLFNIFFYLCLVTLSIHIAYLLDEIYWIITVVLLTCYPYYL